MHVIMRVFITGGTGFVARYLTESLAKDHQVLLVGQNRGITHLDTVNQIRVSYAFTDYSVESLTGLFEEFAPDAVVHLAAQRPTNQIALIPGYLQNLIISSNLFSVCLAFRVHNIVNISSISVYSQHVPLPWREEGPIAPKNEYGLSKLWVEEAAEDYSCRDLNIKTLRLAQVVGLEERTDYIMQIFLERARKGESLKVFGSDEGRRQYIYVKDVVSAIEQSLMHAELSGIYNIGMKENHSFYEVAETINTVFHNDAGIIRDPKQKADTRINKMSIVKASEMLHWEPQYDLKSGYNDMYDQISKAEP